MPINCLKQYAIKYRLIDTSIIPVLPHDIHRAHTLVMLSIKSGLTRKQYRMFDSQCLYLDNYVITHRIKPHWHQALIRNGLATSLFDTHIVHFIPNLVPNLITTHVAIFCPGGHVRHTFAKGLTGKRYQQFWCTPCQRPWHSYRWRCTCNLSWIDCTVHNEVFMSLAQGRERQPAQRLSPVQVPLMTPQQELQGLQTLLTSGEVIDAHTSATNRSRQCQEVSVPYSSLQQPGSPKLHKPAERQRSGTVAHTPRQQPSPQGLTLGPKLAGRFPHLVRAQSRLDVLGQSSAASVTRQEPPANRTLPNQTTSEASEAGLVADVMSPATSARPPSRGSKRHASPENMHASRIRAISSHDGYNFPVAGELAAPTATIPELLPDSLSDGAALPH